MSEWKSYLKRVLPRTIVRGLQASTKFHFLNGWPNLPLIALFYFRNCLRAARDFRAWRASREAIRVYEGQLFEIAKSLGNGKHLHVIYLLKQPAPLHSFHWLLIERMLRTTGADVCWFHYTFEHVGPNWERLKPKLRLVKVPEFDYYGLAKLSHLAHKADIVRLLALYYIGGMYLDIDTLALNSCEELFSSRELILGLQAEKGKFEPYGLCNAAIVAPRGHAAVKRWLGAYRYFRSRGKDKYWDEHSVTMPLRLLRPRKDVRVLSPHMFFEINWQEANMLVDSGSEPLVRGRLDGAYSQHLWESCIMEKLMSDYKSGVPDDGSFLAQELKKTECDLLKNHQA